MEQGTQDWKDIRRGKLTASKAPIILGISPYMTPFQLFEEELGLRDPQPTTSYMQKGLEIEDEARHWFFRQTGVMTKPHVCFHSNPLFMASLDGFNEGRNVILEIKRNNKEFHENTKNGKIPDFHVSQMQHQMFVTNMPECQYLSYREGDEVLKVVKRDDDYIANMIEKELKFKQLCDELQPPPLTDRDYEDVSHDLELEEMIRKYNRMSHEAKSYSKLCDSLKEEIKERAGSRNAKGRGFKLTKYVSRSIIDYDRMIADHCPNVDRNEYKKPPTYAYRITMEN